MIDSQIEDNKILVIGPKGCGKTSLIHCLMGHPFDNFVKPTIGSNVFTLDIPYEDSLINVEIWDISGDRQFIPLMPHYYRNTRAVIGVYDCGNRNSFNQLRIIIQDFLNYVNDPNNVFIFLVGNKVDQSSANSTPKTTITSYIIEIKAQHFLTSAKALYGIETLFQAVIECIHLRSIYPDENELLQSWIVVPEDSPKKPFVPMEIVHPKEQASNKSFVKCMGCFRYLFRKLFGYV